MESLDLGSAILFIVIGIIAGAAISKILGRGPSVSELQQQLEETEDQFAGYRQEVGDHFEQTAQLVNNLTDSYRAVHEHLSKGAQGLAADSKLSLNQDNDALIGFKSLDEKPQKPTEQEIPQVNTIVDSPKDSSGDSVIDASGSSSDNSSDKASNELASDPMETPSKTEANSENISKSSTDEYKADEKAADEHQSGEHGANKNELDEKKADQAKTSTKTPSKDSLSEKERYSV